MYDVAVGYFLTSRGHYSVNDSLRTVVRMPTLYAFALGSLIKDSPLMPGPVLIESVNTFKGACSVVGMMVIGSLGWKYLYWPCLDLLLLTIFGPPLPPAEQGAVLLMCSVPMAATAVMASMPGLLMLIRA